MSTDLIEFLRARFGEDADIAAAAGDAEYGYRTGEEVAGLSAADARHVARHNPFRVLTEFNTKRAVLTEAFRHAAKIDSEWGCCHDADAIERGECEDHQPDDLPIARHLAVPYATHPDYRPEWAPTA